MNHSITCQSIAHAARLADTLVACGYSATVNHDSKGRATLTTDAPSGLLDEVIG